MKFDKTTAQRVVRAQRVMAEAWERAPAQERDEIQGMVDDLLARDNFLLALNVAAILVATISKKITEDRTKPASIGAFMADLPAFYAAMARDYTHLDAGRADSATRH